MQRTLAIALVAACVVATATSALARGAGHGGQGHNPIILSGPEPTPPFVSRIPAPLPPPAQAPVINGPLSQPAFRGLTGIGQ
jgi:hypothetical protein